MSGQVLHLLDFEIPAVKIGDLPKEVNPRDSEKGVEKPLATFFEQQGSQEVSPVSVSLEDREILVNLLGDNVTRQLLELDAKTREAKDTKTGSPNAVGFKQISDRAKRTEVHEHVRRIFCSRIETRADGNGVITATLNPGQRTRKNANGTRLPRNGTNNPRARGQPRGQHLHFTLFKENKDTMEALGSLGRLLGVKISQFGFAGTKDRRAATVQRISISRQSAENLARLNGRIAGVKVGDFKYEDHKISLGQLKGNEFVITIKNCAVGSSEGCSFTRRLEMLQACVEAAVKNTTQTGFINYFGLQRFGTYQIGTHVIGMKILTEDFQGAVDAILYFDPGLVLEGRDSAGQAMPEDVLRARACSVFKSTGNAEAAIKVLPRRFNAEVSVMRHLSRTPGSAKDYTGALLSVSKGLRDMYLHAYQSYVWNWVASKRWAEFGTKVVKGDLIIVEFSGPEEKPREQLTAANDDEWPEEMDEWYSGARALTQVEADTGDYTIWDVVLPLPGYDVIYPENSIGDYYESFMAEPENGGLNPYDMRRLQREFSLSGGYRKLMGRFMGTPSFEVRAYHDDLTQMCPTDVDNINRRRAELRSEELSLKERQAAAQWTAFAEAPTEPDLLQDLSELQRRRKAAETTVLIHDTWKQVSVEEGSFKRVKVAQETSTLTHSLTDSSEVIGDGPRDVAVEQVLVQTVPDPVVKDASNNAGPSNVTSTAEVQNKIMENAKLAVILKFKLHSSQYATIVLRDLMGNV